MNWKPILSMSLLALSLASCNLSKLTRDDSPIAVSQVVKDTLWVFNLQAYENYDCEVNIRALEHDFHGREEVHEGRVWFDVRSFPPARYVLQIKVPGLIVTRWFQKL